MQGPTAQQIRNRQEYTQEEFSISQAHRKAIESSARDILIKIFRASKVRTDLSQLKVLVPCAGTFPSYDVFVEVAQQFFPKLKNIEFVLVDPEDFGLKLFVAHKQTQDKQESKQQVKVQVKVETQELEPFLKKQSGKFDIIYLEHPLVDPVNTLFAQLNIINPNILSLRQSLPYLTNVLQPNGLIIATCKNSIEIEQMASLLKHSLDVEIQTVNTRACVFLASDYSKGLITTTVATTNKKLQIPKAEEIRKSDRSLLLFVMLSALLYSQSGNRFLESTASLFMLFGHFFMHKPGNKGFQIKVVLCLAQTALIISQLVTTRQKKIRR